MPRIRAFTTPLLLALVIANASPTKSINRLAHGNLFKSTTECVKFIIYVVSLDSCNPVYRFLDLYKARRIISFTDASGFERNIKNPSPGCIAGFFDAPSGMAPFAFAIPWAVFQVFLPKTAAFHEPHINYLELMAPIILFVWLCLFFPKFVRNHKFIFKIDSRVAQF